MRILLDEMLPPQLRDMLDEYEISSVQEMGWTGIKNGELLKRASRSFDVFLTADKNLRYQQNLKNLAVAIIVLPSNRVEIIEASKESLQRVLQTITRGTLIEL